MDTGNEGRLMQIATGEGKSIVSASLAAILSLLGRKVDIITSSTVLAAAGHKNAQEFFEILGLSAAIDAGCGEGSGEKPCYGSGMVHGDDLTFQSDLLSDSSHSVSHARSSLIMVRMTIQVHQKNSNKELKLISSKKILVFGCRRIQIVTTLRIF